MNLSYIPRLLCLAFGTFFVAHTLLSLLVVVLSRRAVRQTASMTPRVASRFLFALRVLPAALAIFLVGGFCVPSYLWFEPQAISERIGVACVALGALGLSNWLLVIQRAIGGIALSIRYDRLFRKPAAETLLPGITLPALVLDEDVPVLALSGLLRPRVLISRGVLHALSAEQLHAALHHENAHRISRDNLRRLLLLLTPGTLPYFHGFSALEHHWARLTEWAADDEATRGDPLRALSLASALVRVARIGAGPRLSFLHTSLLPDDRNLSERVDRLLRTAPAEPKPPQEGGELARPAALLLSTILATMPLWPASLSSVHRLLEAFLR